MSNRKRKATVLFDKVIGEPIFWMVNLLNRKTNQHKIPKIIGKILLIKTGGMGDYLLNIPAFKELKEKYPHSKFTLFLFNRNKNFLDFYNQFDEVKIIDKFLPLMSFILSRKKYDMCIDFSHSRKIPSILSILSNADIRIGFKNDGKEKAYTFPVQYSDRKYEAQSFLDLLKPLGINKKSSEDSLSLIKNTNKDKKRVGIYACAMKEENRLPVEMWKSIIQKHGEENEYFFLGSKEDSGRYDELETLLGKDYKIVRMDGKTSLRECLKLISKLSLLISEDGGVYHLAVCSNTPTVSYWLHGKDNMAKWKAPFSKHKGVLLK